LINYKQYWEKIQQTPWLKKISDAEFIRYGFWGVVTSVLNVGVFQLALTLGLDYIMSNALALILTKAVAYLTSKFFVFHQKCSTRRELFIEIFRFIYTRGATMLLDFFGLMLMVEVLNADKLLSKCTVTVLVIIVNYFLGKFHVFRHQRGTDEPTIEKQDGKEERT
jgi:putative flippase GtrA